MIDQNSTYKLSNGVEIPCVGFGMWQTPDNEVGVNSVLSALKAGYTHIDTAQAYRNEDCVGKAIQQSGVNRDDIFITTKIWNDCHSYGVSRRCTCNNSASVPYNDLSRTLLSLGSRRCHNRTFLKGCKDPLLLKQPGLSFFRPAFC